MSILDAENVERRESNEPTTGNASRSGLLRNVAVSYLTMGVSTLTAFFVTPILLRALGKEQFGLWALLLSLLGYVSLVEAGIYTSVSKRVAECMAVHDRNRLKQVLATSMALWRRSRSRQR